MKKAKKWLAVIPLALMSVTMAGMPAWTGTVSAAVANSFSDVPAGHWAYDAVSKLAKAGLIDGYSDKSFQGDKTISRYEFAFIVAKALDRFDNADDANKQLIDKLSAEFASELNRLGTRVSKVETKTNTWVGGETRLRFVSDDPGVSGGSQLKGADRFDFRQRIKFSGTVNDTISWAGRITTSGTNKFGNTEYNSGSEISLDLMSVTAKNVLGMDSIRVGRSALDFYSGGLFGKPMNVDGVLINHTFGNASFKGWTGNIKNAGNNGDANQLTTGQVGFRLADNMNVKTGYYWADIPGTKKGRGEGTVNISGGATASNVFTSSKGWTAGFDYKLGRYTLIGDYVSTTLENPNGLPSNPKGWAVQLSNSQGPAVLFPSVNLVNPVKVGTDAWMASYRSIDPGAIPAGAGNFDSTAVAYAAQPYNIFTHGTDNVNVLYLAYQNVIAKNVILSLEYQDFKIKNRDLTDLSSDKLNQTYMMKFELFY
ncbi:hypothetical protein SCACP_34160 [Sporomusa carbonis]|uniref:S-layer homology domain-containing protein n=1 Tax=Sporomusa carbonis TaxID=3076075 RepID=UPI003A6C5410